MNITISKELLKHDEFNKLNEQEKDDLGRDIAKIVLPKYLMNDKLAYTQCDKYDCPDLLCRSFWDDGSVSTYAIECKIKFSKTIFDDIWIKTNQLESLKNISNKYHVLYICYWAELDAATLTFMTNFDDSMMKKKIVTSAKDFQQEKGVLYPTDGYNTHRYLNLLY